MNKQEMVTIVGDDTNSVIHPSTNPEFAYIRVQQQTTRISNNWYRPEIRTALIHGKLEDLTKANFELGQTLPGKIVVKESLVPFTDTNAQRFLKIAGNTGVICRVEDQPVYRNCYYTTDMNDQDEFIQHTNTDEIKEKAQELKDTPERTTPVL